MDYVGFDVAGGDDIMTDTKQPQSTVLGVWNVPTSLLEGTKSIQANIAKSIAKSQNQAEWAYERLTKQIIDFEGKLNDDEEIGARLVSCPGPEGVFHVEDMSYWGPDLIMFYGTDQDGRPRQLIQHVSQINILLSAIPKKEKIAKRIGFVLSQKKSE